MANSENLKPIRTKSEAREKGQKGGKKSGEVRRQKKTMREMLDYLLEKELTSKNGEKATTLEAMMTAIIKQGLNGNVKAVEFIRDTIGEKPTDKQEITGGLEIQKVFITEKEQQQTDKHIDDVINEQ